MPRIIVARTTSRADSMPQSSPLSPEALDARPEPPMNGGRDELRLQAGQARAAAETAVVSLPCEEHLPRERGAAELAFASAWQGVSRPGGELIITVRPKPDTTHE